MNKNEVALLCRLAKAACPQQAIDEHTPEAWFLLLEPFRAVDAKEALVEIAREQPFVSPAEIIGRVKRLRAARIVAYGDVEVPAGLTEPETRAFLALMRRRIADGEVTERQDLPPSRPMPSLDRVFRAVEA